MILTSTLSQSITYCIEILRQHAVIAYPTEAVFGLGCDPDSWQAVQKLLTLKQRSIDKGFIIVAANYMQLKIYIDEQKLTTSQKRQLIKNNFNSISWIVPAKDQVPQWLTGRFNSIAVRISNHPIVQQLCNTYGKAIVSTSANLSGRAPCRSIKEVRAQFGESFPTVLGETGGQLNPSQIRDIISGKLVR